MIFITPVIVKYMENNLDIMKPCYQEHIFPIPWLSIKSRFYCADLLFRVFFHSLYEGVLHSF